MYSHFLLELRPRGQGEGFHLRAFHWQGDYCGLAAKPAGMIAPAFEPHLQPSRTLTKEQNRDLSRTADWTMSNLLLQPSDRVLWKPIPEGLVYLTVG